MGLEEKSKPAPTPSVLTKAADEEPLAGDQSVMYRALVARANYLAQDRVDIAYAVKELCRQMSLPRVHDWHQLKRLARYLKGSPRLVVKFRYQQCPANLVVWTDTDHAGCLSTRKSTSGGVMMFGTHCLKSWSVNQQHVALSSGEAEYYGMVRGTSQALGAKAMLNDFGIEVGIETMVDASAAVGIACRRGLGKVRHIELDQLWLQNQVARGRVRVYKVSGEENMADSLTKHSTLQRIEQTLWCTGACVVPGRHELMPTVAK